MVKRDWEARDNSHHRLKRELRESFMGEVEGNLCFDLFCGTGTFTRELYASRFLQVICVDEREAALKELPKSPRVLAYHGDNRELGWRLRCKWGFPDFIDLDAYGNPDGALLPLLKLTRGKERFAVVATDGTFHGRCRARPMPECWGNGEQHWAPCCISADNYPVLIYRHAEKWLAQAGYAMRDFMLHKAASAPMYYYGYIAELVT